MSLRIVQSDLFAAPLPHAIAHGCNAKGVMGAGVAKIVRRLFPACYDDYAAICRSGGFAPGDVHHWNEGNQHVFNLCTQKQTGPHATIRAIDEAMGEMLDLATIVAGLYEIHMPKIGCGLGGLRWTDVHLLLQQHAAQTNIDLVVHDYEPRGGK
jgi:O-acetyl-ADP-ribose deacetylase (regulator of RNase III)